MDLKLFKTVTQLDEDAVEGFAVLEYPQGGGGWKLHVRPLKNSSCFCFLTVQSYSRTRMKYRSIAYSLNSVALAFLVYDMRNLKKLLSKH